MADEELRNQEVGKLVKALGRRAVKDSKNPRCETGQITQECIASWACDEPKQIKLEGWQHLAPELVARQTRGDTQRPAQLSDHVPTTNLDKSGLSKLANGKPVLGLTSDTCPLLVKRMVYLQFEAAVARSIVAMGKDPKHRFGVEAPLLRWVVAWVESVFHNISPDGPPDLRVGEISIKGALENASAKSEGFWKQWLPRVLEYYLSTKTNLDDTRFDATVARSSRKVDLGKPDAPNRQRLMDILAGPKAQATLQALCAEFDTCSTSEHVVGNYLKKSNSTNAPEFVYKAWKRLCARGDSSDVLRAWIQAVIPAVLQPHLGDNDVEFHDTSRDGRSVVKVSASSFALAECLFAIAVGRAACLGRHGEELDSPNRIHMPNPPISGERAGRQLTELEAEQMLFDRVADRMPPALRRGTPDLASVKLWWTQHCRRREIDGDARPYIAFFLADRPLSWVESFDAALPVSVGIDLIILPQDSPALGLLRELNTNVHEFITPIFEDKKS